MTGATERALSCDDIQILCSQLAESSERNFTATRNVDGTFFPSAANLHLVDAALRLKRFCPLADLATIHEDAVTFGRLRENYSSSPDSLLGRILH